MSAEQPSRNILLRLSYDGTAYHGWQSQKNAVAVCDTVKNAIWKAVCHGVTLYGCGRTDAGVHAAVYAANFFSDTKIPLDRLPLAINAYLPDDIAVDYAEEVPGDFNAIGSCTGKRYTYLIQNAPVRVPLMHNRALAYKYQLDFDLMRQAADCIVGTRDFAALCGAQGNTKTTVRTVHAIDIERHGDTVSISVTANGFLYNMCRAIVGTLLYVSEGKIAVGDLPGLLESGDRRLTGPTVPGWGLYMTGVWYEGKTWCSMPPTLSDARK